MEYRWTPVISHLRVMATYILLLGNSNNTWLSKNRQLACVRMSACLCVCPSVCLCACTDARMHAGIYMYIWTHVYWNKSLREYIAITRKNIIGVANE